MWSLWVLTKVTIFMAVVKRVCSMALRTFARSSDFKRVSNNRYIKDLSSPS